MLSACRSVLVVAGVALATLGVAAGSALADVNVQERIVVLKDGTSPDKVAKDLGLAPKFLYRYALRGFAADMGDTRAAQVEADGRVLFVAEDQLRPAAVPVGPGQRSATDLRDIPQVIPYGIERVGALASRTARIDGRQDPLDVDIAVIDTGVESANSDLRVVNGQDCVPGGDASTEDLSGHGTHAPWAATASVTIPLGCRLTACTMLPSARPRFFRTFVDCGEADQSDRRSAYSWSESPRVA